MLSAIIVHTDKPGVTSIQGCRPVNSRGQFGRWIEIDLVFNDI